VYLNHLEFADRQNWVKKHHPDKDVMFIEVGGAGDPGAAGCAEIWDEFPFEPDVLVLATATGTTMQGLLAGRDERRLNTQIIGIPVLFNAAEQRDMLDAKGFQNCILEPGFECGGFARVDTQLMEFIQAQIQRTNILFDPVYTGKAWFGLHRLLERGSIAPGVKIVFLHTGGSLGLFSERYLDFFR
jgi:1-aminocyclopropane-1-carboxylate deaminase